MVQFQNKFQKTISNNSFTKIKNCNKCGIERNKTLPHEFAVVGNKYGHSLKILILGKAPNADPETIKSSKNGYIPNEYQSYFPYNSKILNEFPKYDPLYESSTHRYAIKNILHQISKRNKKKMEFNLVNISFTNFAHCYNLNGWKDKKQVEILMDNCWKFVFDEIRILEPDIIIGLGYAVNDWFEWFGKKKSGPLVEFYYRDKISTKWCFLSTNEERLYVYFYHPSYFNTKFGRKKVSSYKRSFDERLHKITEYIDNRSKIIS